MSLAWTPLILCVSSQSFSFYIQHTLLYLLHVYPSIQLSKDTVQLAKITDSSLKKLNQQTTGTGQVCGVLSCIQSMPHSLPLSVFHIRRCAFIQTPLMGLSSTLCAHHVHRAHLILLYEMPYEVRMFPPCVLSLTCTYLEEYLDVYGVNSACLSVLPLIVGQTGLRSTGKGLSNLSTEVPATPAGTAYVHCTNTLQFLTVATCFLHVYSSWQEHYGAITYFVRLCRIIILSLSHTLLMRYICIHIMYGAHCSLCDGECVCMCLVLQNVADLEQDMLTRARSASSSRVRQLYNTLY